MTVATTTVDRRRPRVDAIPIIEEATGMIERTRWALADGWAVTRRNLTHVRYVPEKLLDVTLQPILFVLLFVYVFGNAINVPGGSYVQFLMAGIFVQTMMFGAQGTALGMAEDLHNGIIERFRSLVMSRSALLAGRVLADALRNVFVVALMIGVGYLVGFRLHTNLAALLAAVGVLLLFGIAISWVAALIGLTSKSAEAAGAAALPIIVLLGFPSSAFVLTSHMPRVLRAYANHQPLTATVDTIRPLLLGGPTSSHAAAAVIWCLGIIAVFAPLAVLRYRRAG